MNPKVDRMNQDQEEEIKIRGYYLWQESGGSHGHDREDWDRATHEIQATERSRQDRSAEPVDEQRQHDLGALPYSPVALFFRLAQGWVESGRVIASMTPWSLWSVRAR